MKKTIILLAFLSAINYCRAQNLVAHYDFNSVSGANGSPIPDVSGNGHNGTVRGTAVSTGSGLQFGGSAYVAITPDIKLELKRWTLRAQVTFNRFGTSTSNPTCQVNNLIRHSYSGSGSFYGMQTDDNNWEVHNGTLSSQVCNTMSQQQQVYGVAAGGGPGWTTYPSPAAGHFSYLQTGVQYCLTVTYDIDDSVRAYVNGNLWYTMPWTNNYTTLAPDSVFLGAGPGGYFDGVLDDVQLYDYAASPAQLAGSGCAVIQSPIVSTSCSDSCYWKVTGNNILSSGSNIFGTRTIDDVQLYTANNPRGMFTKEGNFQWGPTNVLDPATTVSTSLGVSNTTTSSANTAVIGYLNNMDNSEHSIIAGRENVVTGSSAIGIVGGYFSSGNTVTNTKESFSVGVNNVMTSTIQSMTSGAGNRITGGGTDEAFGDGNRIDSSGYSFAVGGGNHILKSFGSITGGSSNSITTSSSSVANGTGNTITSQNWAFAAGLANNLNTSGTASAAIGRGNQLAGDNTCLAAGDSNNISNSTAAMVMGSANTVQSSQSVNVSGRGNLVTGSQSSLANGLNNSIINGTADVIGGQANVVNNGGGINNANAMFGRDNLILNSTGSGLVGVGNQVLNATTSFTAGSNNIVNGNNSFVFGANSQVTAGSANNVVLGAGNTASGTNEHVYGSGISGNLNNSIVMGFANNRTTVITARGVAIQMNPGTATYIPQYNLEVQAQASSGSNIAFHNLPKTLNTYPIVVVDTVSGELFRVANSMIHYGADQGITFNAQTSNFELGYACGSPATSLFTVNREIGMNNHDLSFNSRDNGHLYMGGQTCKQLITRLEISSAGLSPTPQNGYINSIASPSGLRFTDLTHQITPTPAQPVNGKYGVLSLDNEGDVIWVEDQTGTGGATADNGCSINPVTQAVQLGEPCNSNSNAARLTDDDAIPMNDYNLIFRDGLTARKGANRVGIGTLNCLPNAKLEVVRNQEAGTGYDVLNRAFIASNHDISPNEATAVYAESDNPQNVTNIGGDFLAQNGHAGNYGVRGIAMSPGGPDAYGGWFRACNARNMNVGVYADACNPGGTNSGMGPGWAAYFNEDVYAVNGVYTSSDARLKKNIQPISNALEILSKIEPKKYQFNTSVYPGLHLHENAEDYGVIAQQIETVLPSLVKEAAVPDGDKGFLNEKIKTVNYTELIPILIQAVKDQQTVIVTGQQRADALQAENGQMKAQLARLEEKFAMLENSVANICENGCPGLSNKGANTKATDAVPQDQLFQSIPNPTDNKAIINYSLVADRGSAYIIIADLSGKVVGKIVLAPKAGNGSVSVELGEYAAQTYVYSLFVNEQLIDSKRMTVIR